MDKARRRKRFQQKKRNHDKWEKRIKSRKRIETESTRASDVLDDYDLRNIGVYANHGKTCSCSGCGNPRRNGWLPNEEKRTIQERRFLGD